MGRLKKAELVANQQPDLFVPLFEDISLRDIQDAMVYPFFSLTTGQLEPLVYKDNKVEIEIVPANKKEWGGVATIHDRDILQWAISRIREQLDRGEQPQRTIYFNPYDLLLQIHRSPNGSAYDELERALLRLSSTLVATSVRSKDVQDNKGFHWLDSYSAKHDREDKTPKGMWSITVSNWVYQGAVNHKGILSFDSRYFALTSPIERVLYLFARKLAGSGRDNEREFGFRMKMKEFYKRSGTSREYKYFRRDVNNYLKRNDHCILEYYIKLYREEPEQDDKKRGDEFICFWNRYKRHVPKAYRLDN